MAQEEKVYVVAPIPETIIDKNTGNKYERGRFYGKGGFGRCYEIKDSKTNQMFAAKIVSKKILVKKYQKNQMTQEINIHKHLRHKNVVAYHGTFDDDNFVYILLELCHQRSLAELHSRRKVLTEPETRYFMKQISEGVLYLHKMGVVHRDLKLANLLLSDDLEVKIGDFGLAAKIEYKGQRRTTVCGTPNYVAPEILHKIGYSFEVDVWSMGCVMYTLLVGKPPFETAKVEETYERIKRCQYAIPTSLRSDAATLICRMLQPDPRKRPTVEEILAFEFFQGYIPSALPLSCLTVAPRTDTIIANESLASLRKPLLEINHARNTPKMSQRKNVRIATQTCDELQDEQSARKLPHQMNGVRESPKTARPLKTAASPGIAFNKQLENLPPVLKESRFEVNREVEEGIPVRMREEGNVRSPSGAGDVSKTSPKKAVSDPCSCSNKKPPLATTTADTCRKYLKTLRKQIDRVVLKVHKVDAQIIPAVEDELTDPAAQPVTWVMKWLDYSEKYGFGYQLNDGSFAIVFNDHTHLILLANLRNIHYIEWDGTENYYTIDDTPEFLNKKMKLLNYFRKYMCEELAGAGYSIVLPESCKYDLSRSPYMYYWKRFKQEAIIMQLTNGTIQINFKDHTKIIMCPLMKAVTYIDPVNNVRTYKFSTIIQNGCHPRLLYALSYASHKIETLIETAKEYKET